MPCGQPGAGIGSMNLLMDVLALFYAVLALVGLVAMVAVCLWWWLTRNYGPD
jgi:hypothetical protein